MHPYTKRLLRIVATVGFLVPPTALAAIALQLPADAIAGLGFDLLVSGMRGGETVAVQMERPNGDLQGLRGTADTNGTATLAVRGSLTEESGVYHFNAGDTTSDLTVLPDSVDPVLSSIDVWTPRIQNDGQDAASVTVTLRDQFGNPLPGRIATLVSGRSDDDVASETNDTDEHGEQHFSVRTYEPGTLTLRAIDLLSGIPLADSATIRSGSESIGGPSDSVSRMSNGNRFYYAQVAGFDVIDGFEIDAPSSLPLGEEASKITIRAVDRNGSIVENYVGTVEFSSTDPDATLPNFGRYTFKERDLGQKEFPLVLKFKQSGQQTFRVEDRNDRTIFGDVTITVASDERPGGGTLTLLSPKDGSTVNGSSVTVTGTGPAFTNIVVLGGIEDTPGSTDANGQYSVTIPLRPDQRDYTIRVQDENGRLDSGPILVHLDADPPAIGTITFTPAIPEEGEKVLVAVKSEAGLASMLLTITQRNTGAVQEITLLPTSAGDTYQAFFTAPQPDAYQPKLLAVDKAGNTAELRTTLTIGTPGLPVVEGVIAEPRVNAVRVGWQEIEEETVDGYRVYVGENPGQFGYFLDTKQRTNSAIVAGLSPSKQYFFAVTALQGDRESVEKSGIVTATVLGMALNVIPDDQSLRLQWSTLDDETPLSHFLLEYGLDEAHFTEQRLLNRDLTEYALRDLLNGIEYAVRITPVTVAGKLLTDLSALRTGTPSGTGFHPGAGDPIPYDITEHPGELPTVAPQTPVSGIPAMLGWTMLLAALGGGWYHLRRRAERHRTAQFLASLPTYR